MKRIKLSPKARLIRDAIRELHDLELACMVEFYQANDDAAKLAQQHALDCGSAAMCLGSSYAACVVWGSVTLSSTLGELHPTFAVDGRVFCPEAKKIVDKLRADFTGVGSANTAAT